LLISASANNYLSFYAVRQAIHYKSAGSCP
jgi:hypothetical protein